MACWEIDLCAVHYVKGGGGLRYMVKASVGPEQAGPVPAGGALSRQGGDPGGVLSSGRLSVTSRRPKTDESGDIIETEAAPSLLDRSTDS